MNLRAATRRRTLSGRLSLFMLGTTVLGLLAVLVAGFLVQLILLRHGQHLRAREMAEMAAVALAEPLERGDDAAVFRMAERYAGDPNVLWLTVMDGEGRVVARSGAEPERGGAIRGGHAIASGGRDLGRVLIGVTALLKGQSLFVLSSVLCALLLAASVLYIMSVRHLRRRVIGPLDQLAEAMSGVAQSKDYSRRLEHHFDDEVGQLVAAFNGMLAEVQQRDEWLERHRELLENMVQERTHQLDRKRSQLTRRNRQLSLEIMERRKAEMIREEVERINRHDLKSALNLVTGYPEMMLEMGGLSEQQRLYLEIIRDTGYRIMDQIRNQLDIFRMEKGFYKLEPAPVNLVEVVLEVEEELAPLLARREASLAVELDGKPVTGLENLVVMGERALLSTMMRNLLVNAVEASRAGETIQVAMHRGTRIRLAIRNQEPVPEAIRDRFFEKYATYGKESGTGLGTYSARLIAWTHGARITLRTGDRLGTIVRVAFPVPAEAAAS